MAVRHCRVELKLYLSLVLYLVNFRHEEFLEHDYTYTHIMS